MVRDLVDDALSKINFHEETRERVAEVLTRVIEEVAAQEVLKERTAPAPDLRTPAELPRVIEAAGEATVQEALERRTAPAPDLRTPAEPPRVIETAGEAAVQEALERRAARVPAVRSPAEAPKTSADRAQTRAPRRPPAQPKAVGEENRPTQGDRNRK
jgi:hypothetical protein